MNISYTEQLRHPYWQRKRLEVLQSADFHCERCGSGEKTLHVHHKRYVKGRMAWEYERHELMALCEDCHGSHHETRDLLDAILTSVDVEVVTNIVAGYAAVYGVALESELDRIARQVTPEPARRQFVAGIMAAFVAIDAEKARAILAVVATIIGEGPLRDLMRELAREQTARVDKLASEDGREG